MYESFRNVAIDRVSVIYEEVDGEVIVIHKSAGIYYSLRDTARDVWQLIACGKSFDEMVDLFAADSQTSREEIFESVVKFITLLKRENLVVPASPCASANGVPRHNGTVFSSGLSLSGIFREPLLEKFENMREYMLADPIHESDALGWDSTGGTQSATSSPRPVFDPEAQTKGSSGRRQTSRGAERNET